MTTEISRVDPPNVADERTMLEAWLDFHRATLAMKCEGLTAEQLRDEAVPPSNLSLLGLVRHMAEVERGWFRKALAGEDVPEIYCTEADRDGEFHNLEEADPAEAFATWRGECDQAREIVASTSSLDTLAALERRGKPVSLRLIMVHMIEEYARHNGHADLLRERIDGTVGD
jgi:uncharacterized damage-inducible protein DinB